MSKTRKYLGGWFCEYSLESHIKWHKMTRSWLLLLYFKKKIGSKILTYLCIKLPHVYFFIFSLFKVLTSHLIIFYTWHWSVVSSPPVCYSVHWVSNRFVYLYIIQLKVLFSGCLVLELSVFKDFDSFFFFFVLLI